MRTRGKLSGTTCALAAVAMRTLTFQPIARRFRTAGSLLVLLSLFPSAALASQPLAVFLEGGRTYSTDNRGRVAESKRAKAGADLAVGEILPGLQIGATYTHNQHEVVLALPGGPELTLQPRNQFDAAFRLRVPLIDIPGYFGARAAHSIADAASARLTATQLDVDREVAAAYFEHAAAGALSTSAKKSVDSAAENLRFVEDLLSAERTTDLERERATANLERARQDEADALLAILLSARRLRTLSGITPTAPSLPPADELRKEAPLSYFLGRVDATSAAAAARATTAAAKEAYAAARAALLPTLTGVAQERLTSPASNGQHDSYLLLLALDFRFDFTTLPQQRVRAADVELAQAQAEAVQRGVADDIYEAYRRVETLIVKCQAARAQAKAAERAAELAAVRFEAGKATQLDVTQAQRDAFLADASRIQADASLAFARVALRLASNLPLPNSASHP